MSEINNNMTKPNANAPIKAALGSKDDSVEKKGKWNSVMWRDFTYLKSEEGSETVLSLHSCPFTCTINCKDSYFLL